MAENPTIEKLLKKLDKEPNPLIFLQLAEEYRKESLYDDALQVCRDGLRRHPNYWSMRVAVGRIYHEMGDFDKSRDELEKVIKAVPDNLLANKLLGDIYMQQGRQDDALKRYKIVQMITPADPDVEANIQKIEGFSVAAPSKPLVPEVLPPPPRFFTPTEPVQPEVAPASLEIPEPAAPIEPSFLEKTAPGIKIPEPASAMSMEPALDIEAPAFPDPEAPVAIMPEAEVEEHDAAVLDTDTLEQLMNQASETGSTAYVPSVGPSIAYADNPSNDITMPPQMEEFSATDINSFELEPEAEVRIPAEDRTQPMDEPVEPPSETVGEEADELTSQTLAELYVQQGLIDKAVRVYQKLLMHDPTNTKIIQRLKELGPAEPLLTPNPAREDRPRTSPSPRAKDAPAVQIRNVEQMSDDRRKKISTLENWLSTIRRERS